jgi:ubiquinone/menaquinone biosynthesis C-methylase UbiE
MMERIPEPELMVDAAQVLAYANADFSRPHQRFVELLDERFPDLPPRGIALDLGCGHGDVSARFARAFPGWRVHGVDGSHAMLQLGTQRLRLAGLSERVELHHCHLPQCSPPLATYDLVFSNSLLHHLHAPEALWLSLRRWGRSRGPVFVKDLFRPPSDVDARRLVNTYAGGEPELLRHDFERSLCAAYSTDEVRAQLQAAGLSQLRVELVSDRHFITWGWLQ